jgi:quercetin dioxygenase-like cupin family protein
MQTRRLGSDLKRIAAATAMSLSWLASAFAQTNPGGTQSVTIARSGSQPSRTAPAENFTGSVRIAPLFQAKDPSRANGATVTFQPGARTAWHSHPLGQTLIVTAGSGRVQGWGGPIEEIRPGDVVSIPPGEKHWHGAAPDTAMTHIAITEQLGGETADWLEKVSDAQYNAPLSPGDAGVSEPAAAAMSGGNGTHAPLAIEEQGSFAIGGTVISNPGTFDPENQTPAGQTLHGDHAYVFFQIPVNPRKLLLVLWHGAGQFSKTWETTPDGREGYQNLFLRRGFGVYVIDQPRRGDAGRSTEPMSITPTPDEQGWFGGFRLGIWPDYFSGVQFSRDPEALNQYFRQMTPNTGPFDVDVVSRAVAALFEKIGPGILVTHSQGGGPGWRTAIKSENVRAIVAYEPGSNFIFPEGSVPPPLPSSFGPLEALGVPLSEFMQLTKIPIVIYYGDYIPKTPTANPGQDQWRVRLSMARLWRDAVNGRGGDVTVVHLPDVGIRGNTHFPFSDLNNLQIADLMSDWLKSKGLDR